MLAEKDNVPAQPEIFRLRALENHLKSNMEIGQRHNKIILSALFHGLSLITQPTASKPSHKPQILVNNPCFHS